MCSSYRALRLSGSSYAAATAPRVTRAEMLVNMMVDLRLIDWSLIDWIESWDLVGFSLIVR